MVLISTIRINMALQHSSHLHKMESETMLKSYLNMMLISMQGIMMAKLHLFMLFMVPSGSKETSSKSYLITMLIPM